LGEEVVGLFVVGGISNQPIFVFVIKDVLVPRVLEHLLPTISMGAVAKPVVEDQKKFRTNFTG
jgi:hypothetical protein